jgi:hypothetical protein
MHFEMDREILDAALSLNEAPADLPGNSGTGHTSTFPNVSLQ